MIKRLLIALVVIFLSFSSFAQVTIGTPNGTTSQLPIEGLVEYTYSQQIIYQTEIDAVGNITYISFFYVSGASTNSKKWEIYLGHTAKSSFDSFDDWVAGGNLTKVFDGTVTFPAGNNFMQINFSTPFAYNNIDNLVVGVVEKEAGNNNDILFAKTATERFNPPRGIYFSADILPDPNDPPEAFELFHYTNYLILGGLQQGCPYPINLEVTDPTLSSLTLSWTPQGTGTSWEVRYGLKGFNPATSGTTLPSSNSSLTISGLQSQTEYDFYVRTVCASGDHSSWSTPVTASTLCTASDMPYLLDFDSGTNCVAIENRGTGRDWVLVQGENSGFSGIYAAYSWSRSAANAWLYTQALNLQTGIFYKLTYKYGNNSSSKSERMKVAVGNMANADTMTTILADHPNITGGAPQYHEVVFQVSDPGEYFIGFNVYSDANQYYLFLDDILIEEIQGNVFVFDNHTWTPQNPAGVSTAADMIVVMNGEATLPSSTNVKDIIIHSGAVLNVTSVLNLYGDLTIHGDLVFKSTATGNGELGQVSSASTIFGNATVERYSQSSRSYRMVSSAVTTSTSIHDNWQEGATSNTDNPHPGYGTHITGTTTDQTNGFDGTQTGNPSMFTLNYNTAQFAAINNTNSNTLQAGTPYLLLIRGDRSVNLNSNTSQSATTLRAKGSLHKGDHHTNYLTTRANTFVMFGNPYQSAVDINAVFAASTNVNAAYYYVYDPMVGDAGGYVTVALPEGNNNTGSAAGKFLQPGQAAQFITSTAAPSSILFTESAKAPGNFSNTGIQDPQDYDNMNIRLYTIANYQNGKLPHDGITILFDDDFDNTINSEDALKPMNFTENLAIEKTGKLLSIEKRKMPADSESYKLFVNGYKHTDYILSFAINKLENVNFYLEDNYTGETVVLTDGNLLYNFSVNNQDASRATDRFIIRVESSLGVTDHTVAGLHLFPNPVSNDVFYLQGHHLNGIEVAVDIADISGRQVFTTKVNAVSGQAVVDMKGMLATGVYLVTTKIGEEFHTFRLIKN